MFSKKQRKASRFYNDVLKRSYRSMDALRGSGHGRGTQKISAADMARARAHKSRKLTPDAGLANRLNILQDRERQFSPKPRRFSGFIPFVASIFKTLFKGLK